MPETCHNLFRHFTRLLTLVLSLAFTVHAQDSATGSIRGVVFDATGARIPQASIVVVNSATSARYAVISNPEGRFTLELLPPGDYSAQAEANGMSPQETPPLHVDVGGTAQLEFRLTVAGAGENCDSLVGARTG